MITDLEKAANHIAFWIHKQAQNAGAKSLVLGISGGVDSAVVAGLCARTGMRTVGVLMPCHSSPSSISRGLEVVNGFKIAAHTVDLEGAFDCIAQAVGNPNPGNEAAGALRSCLRAPTLDYVGKLHNGIIVGTGNRDEDEVTRYFQKRGDGCVDISPIAKLHKSEIYQLAEFLGVPRSVIQATPSADLWGPDAGQEDEKQLGLSYKEVEWGIRQGTGYHPNTNVRHEDFTTVLERNEFVATKANGQPFTEREKVVLETLARMERASRHKENPNLPVCELRHFDFVN